LKHEFDGDLVVYGSGRLAATLLAGGLVDELRLLVYPFVAGAGQPLLGGTGHRDLRRREVQPVGDSLTLLTYRTG
jgi:dihydrofolate reductase